MASVANAAIAQGGKAMHNHETYFSLIEKFSPNEGPDTDTVEIALQHTPQVFRLSRTDSRFIMWSRWLKEAFNECRPTYLVVRRVNAVIDNIRLVSLGSIDSLELSNDKQQLKVGILPSPSFYHVSTNLPSYNEVRARLQAALNSKRPIYIVSGDAPLEIIDARFPDPAWPQPKLAQDSL